MLKKLFLILLVLAPMATFAQDKIAYINAEVVFGQMPEMKDVEAKLLAEREKIKKVADGIEAEYKAKVEGFKDTPTEELTEAILLDRQKQLGDLESRFETYTKSSQEGFEKMYQSLMAPLQEKMKKAIKEVGDENGYTYIVNSGVLLHVGANAIDAGPKVKAKLGIAN